MRAARTSFIPVLTAAVTLAAALAGCGGSSTVNLDNVSLERAIANSILHEHHLYSLVSCPIKPQRKGVKFTCEAHFTVGDYPVTVTETDNKGHVSYTNSKPLRVLDTLKVESAIVATLKERGLHAKVSCPTNVLQEKGLTFSCNANVGGTVTPFKVTETDNLGHVHYIGE